MNVSTTRQFRYGIYAVAVLLALALVCAFQFHTEPNAMGQSRAETLNDGWAWQAADGRWVPLETAPCSIAARDSSIILRRTLAGLERSEQDVLLFRTRYASMRAWLDGELIYEGAVGRDRALGELWHFVSMEGHADARELVVELRHYDGETNWVLSQVLMDEPAALRSWLLSQALPQLIFTAVTVLVAILLLVAGIVMAVRRLPTWTTLTSLALFMLLAGMWILLDCRITTIWGGNYSISYFLGYAALHLLLVPYLLLFHSVTGGKYRWPVVLMWVAIGSGLTCFLIHIQGVVSLRYSSVVVPIQVLAAMVQGAKNFITVTKQRTRGLRWTFLGGLAVNVTGLAATTIHFVDEVWSITGYHTHTITALMAAGLLTFLISTIVDAMKIVGDVVRVQASSEHLTLLATQDSMTQLRNRNVFHTDLEKVVCDSPEQVAVAVFDMDGLKVINDKFGHHVGDQAIYMAAHQLEKEFKDVGHCYRLGGDEFCAIVVGRQAVRAMGPAMEAIEAWAGTCSAADGAPVSLSQGCAIWQRVDSPLTRRDLQNLMDKADARMYQYKQARKRGRDTLVQK